QKLSVMTGHGAQIGQPQCPIVSMEFVSIVSGLLVKPQWEHAHNSLVKPIKANTEYDYIIIGSGSAGSVLANRLSAKRKVNVLLIEAGGAQNPQSDIPLQLAIR